MGQPCEPNVKSISPTKASAGARQCFTATVVLGTRGLSHVLVSIPGFARGNTKSNGTARLCGTVPRFPTSGIAPFTSCETDEGREKCFLPVNAYRAGYGSDTDALTISVEGTTS
jgi:hypothetical protein